jgi:hypothetical protein
MIVTREHNRIFLPPTPKYFKILSLNKARIKRKTKAAAAFLGDSAGYSLNQNPCCANVTV